MNAGLSVEQCATALKEMQNGGGGWGFHQNAQSRVEPTCWAMSALASATDCATTSSLHNATQFLLAEQAKDGFWKASPEMTTGNWVTALASAVLAQQSETEKAALAAIAWLCKDYPLDSSPLMRFIRSLSRMDHVSSHENAYRGWGWTPRTASWVEPTAFAMLAMQQFNSQRLPAVAVRRQKLALGLLYDRMCPGGGWNCGNPRVYGVAGAALVLPTAWALIALRDLPEHPNKSLSLAWLENQTPKINSPGSLAVASMCLECYSKQSSQPKERLHNFGLDSLLEDGIHVLAWVCLALNPQRAWPARLEGRHEYP